MTGTIPRKSFACGSNADEMNDSLAPSNLSNYERVMSYIRIVFYGRTDECVSNESKF